MLCVCVCVCVCGARRQRTTPARDTRSDINRIVAARVAHLSRSRRDNGPSALWNHYRRQRRSVSIRRCVGPAIARACEPRGADLRALLEQGRPRALRRLQQSTHLCRRYVTPRAREHLARLCLSLWHLSRFVRAYRRDVVAQASCRSRTCRRSIDSCSLPILSRLSSAW